MDSMKTKIAKIELHLHNFLEAANREFNDALKSWDNPHEKNKSFKNCGRKYVEIMELIEHNRKKNNISNLLESYYLEAWLGKIQSQLNDLPQDPSNEDIVLSNDKKIEKLKKSLTRLMSETKKFDLHTKKTTNKALRKDYRDQFNKTKNYFFFWDKTIFLLKATYYFNFARSLIKELENLSTITNDYDYDHKMNLFSTIILCLETCIDLYKELEQQKDAKFTAELLKNIQDELDDFSKIKKPAKRKFSDPSEASDLKKKKITTTESVNNPPQPSNALTNHESSINKKSYISPSKVKVPINNLLKLEEEKLQQTEKHFKNILNKASIENSYRFYARLFFDLSQQLQASSKDSSNHTLLTRLSWLTIAKELTGLTSNKNPVDITQLETIDKELNLLLIANQRNLKTISSQKRAEAYPTYSTTILEAKNLQSLFIEETMDYYYGLEAFNLDSVATNFLNLIPQIINNQNSSNNFNKIKEIIHNTHKPNESLFHANLLRELVKFHICDENEKWQKDTFLPGSKNQLHKEYKRILTISKQFAEISGPQGHILQDKINRLINHLEKIIAADPKYPTNGFFQQPKQNRSVSVELLNTTLQEHILCLFENRAATIHSETIYNHLLQFIQTHCQEQQTNNNYFKVSKP